MNHFSQRFRLIGRTIVFVAVQFPTVSGIPCVVGVATVRGKEYRTVARIDDVRFIYDAD